MHSMLARFSYGAKCAAGKIFLSKKCTCGAFSKFFVHEMIKTYRYEVFYRLRCGSVLLRCGEVILGGFFCSHLMLVRCQKNALSSVIRLYSLSLLSFSFSFCLSLISLFLFLSPSLSFSLPLLHTLTW